MGLENQSLNQSLSLGLMPSFFSFAFNAVAVLEEFSSILYSVYPFDSFTPATF